MSARPEPQPVPIESIDVAADFRQSMSLVAAGVVLVTTTIDDRPWGMTITACCSVSAAPPTVLISLFESTATAAAISARGEYGINILPAHAMSVAKFGAAPGQPKFLDELEGAMGFGSGRTPAIAGAMAHLDCDVVQEISAGDHVIFLGQVRDVTFPSSGEPLVYYSRQYHRVVPALEVVSGHEQEQHALVYSAW